MPAQSVPYASPAVRAYANELSFHRERAGHNKAELSALLGYTPQYVGQVEACKSKPSEKFAEDCDTFFHTDGVFVRLWKNVNDTRHLTVLPPGFADYLEREAEAATVKTFSALLVHGLFQTPDYARAIMAGSNDAETATALVAGRMERQARILDREQPPQLFLVVDEGALSRLIGDKETHREQLRHLLELSARPNILVNVVRRDHGYYQGLTGSFTLLGFADGSHAAYTESAGAGMLIEEPARVAGYLVRWDVIGSHAETVGASSDLIRAAMEGL